MSSELIWKSIDIHYRLNRYMSTFPILWNPKQREFTITHDHKRLAWWYFSIVVIVYIGWIGTISLLFLRQMISPKENISTYHCLIWGLSYLSSGAAIGVGIAAVHPNGVDNVEILNQMIKVEQGLRQAANRVKAKNSPIWKTIEGKVDILGLMCVTNIPIFFFITPFLTCMGMIEGLDPWKFLIEDILPSEIYSMWVTKCIIFVSSFVLIFAIIAEIMRCIPFLGIFVIFPIRIILYCIQVLNDLHDTTVLDGCDADENLNTVRYFYNQLLILNIAARKLSAPQTFFLTGFGSFATPILIFASLKLYDVLPPNIYPIFPFSGALVFLAVLFVLPFAISVYENSEASLATWRGQVHPKNKFLRKSLRAMRSMRFTSGLGSCHFFKMDQEVQGTYFSTIIDNTINILVSIPQSTIDEWSRSRYKV